MKYELKDFYVAQIEPQEDGSIHTRFLTPVCDDDVAEEIFNAFVKAYPDRHYQLLHDVDNISAPRLIKEHLPKSF